MFANRSVIFLFFVSSISAFDDYEVLSSKKDRLSKADYCLQQGTLCSEDCTAVLYCSSAEVSPIVTVNCTALNLSCFSDGTNVATCSSTNSDCEPSPLTVKCTEAGIFPDPYNCRKSFTCENNNPVPTDQCLCPPGQVWLGPSNGCSTQDEIIQNCCRDSAVVCDDPTAIGSNYGPCVIAGLGYYYICERDSGITTINLQKCSSGLIWSPTTYICESPESRNLLIRHNEKEIKIDQKLVKDLPVCVSDLTTTTDTPTESTHEIPPYCSFPGQILFFPGDRQKYWTCNDDLQPLLHSCNNGTHIECSEDGCHCIPGSSAT